MSQHRFERHGENHWRDTLTGRVLPRLAGGDNALADPPSLKSKLKGIEDDLAGLKSDRHERHQAFTKARDEFAAEEGYNTEGDAFKAAETASKAVSEVDEKVAGAKAAQLGILRMLGQHDAPADPVRDERGGKALERNGWDSRKLVTQETLKALGVLGRASGKFGRVGIGELVDREGLKAALTRLPASAGGLYTPDREPVIDFTLTRQVRITDLITIGQTDSDLIEYVQQTQRAPAVATVLDGTIKPESAYAFALRDAKVVTFAHWVPAHKQALSDAAQLRSIIDQQLREDVDLEVERQSVAGDGVGDNLVGILNTTGIAAVAKGAIGFEAENAADAIHRGITAIRLSYQEPTAIGMHPTTWEKLRLSKTTDGSYYWGGPALSGLQTVWGFPAVVSTIFPVGTAVAADWRKAQLWLREGLTVAASDSHADYFIRNMVAILAEMRGAFTVRRPDAFAKVTAL